MIWIILLGGMVQGAFAQNLEIKGNGAGRSQQKKILEFANVVLQNNGLFFCSGYDYGYEGAFFY